MACRRSAPLPRGWTKHIKSGLLHPVQGAARRSYCSFK